MSSASRIISFVSAATLATLSWTTPAFAEEQSASTTAVADAATRLVLTPSFDVSPSAPEAAAERPSPFGSKPVPASALATKRGGDRVFNDAQLKGVVADNQASNLTTGMNVVSDGAFSSSSGMSTVIQNSGNNVLIQNSTIVNVQVK